MAKKTLIAIGIANFMFASLVYAQQTQSASPITAQLPQPVAEQKIGDLSNKDVNPYQQATLSNPVVPPSVPHSGELPPMPEFPSKEFKNSAGLNLSMSPEEIRLLRRMLWEREVALNESPITPPKPVTSTLPVSLSPGSTPPLLRTFANIKTSFVVLDATGQPWPVENFAVGSDSFLVKRLDNDLGSTFSITTLSMSAQSNLIIKLQGNPTPVVVDLVAGQREVDVRTELRVQGRGPNALVSANSLIKGFDANLNSVLDGVSPSGGKELTVVGSENIKAWKMPDDKMIIRSPFKLTSIANPNFARSADGTHVYEIPATTKISAFIDGKFITFSITGW